MSKRLFVGNLPFKMTKAELEKAFAAYGKIHDATIITNKFSGRSKGFGFVTIENDHEAQKAIQEMNGKEVQGRSLIVNEAKPMQEKGERRDSREEYADTS